MTSDRCQYSDEELATAELPLAGQLLVWGMRRWIQAVCRREAPTLVIARPYIELGCADAVPLLDETMALLSATARRKVALRCLSHPTLGYDETVLLRTMRSLQEGAEPVAQAIVEELLPRRLTATFCRPAGAYAAVLTNAGLPLRASPRLRVVKS